LRISVAELEVCAQDVAGWVRAKLNPAGGGPRLGYAGAVKLGIYSFHKSGNETAARAHLRDLLDRFQGSFQKAAAEQEFESYLRWYTAQQPIVASHRVRLGLALGSGIILGGEVSRVDVDLTSGGYRAVQLGAPRRMPLIQLGIADKYQREAAEVRVGFQHLDGSNLSLVSFSEAELQAAGRGARGIAQQVAAEWVRQGGAVP
jgi:hypothetical protein